MSNHTALIERFYTAFQQRDYRTMQAMYHPQATFSDPVFPGLSAEQTKAMWEMLLTSATDLKVTFNSIRSSGTIVHCHWEAWYTFSKTKRKVHNIIEASFQFEDDLIVRHVDKFDLWRWSRMALGARGTLLGWSPLVKGKIRKIAADSLHAFLKRKAQAKNA
jgi:hypothetical protein